ncbi:MAG: hypothetical protein IJW92_01905, partial [Clostridia bacterium]|nr:hypothetical protein [Clostridia bacterium]
SSFFKSSRSGGRGALLALRRGRNSLFMALFFLPSFFFCAFLVKRKSGANKFVQYYKLNTFGLQPASLLRNANLLANFLPLALGRQSIGIYKQFLPTVRDAIQGFPVG